MFVKGKHIIPVSEIDLPLGYKLRPDKLNRFLVRIKAFTLLASVPFFGHAWAGQMANLSNGMFQQMIKTMINGPNANFTFRQWSSAYKDWILTHSKEMFTDYWGGKAGAVTEFGQRMQFFGVFEGQLRDEGGKAIRKQSTIRKLLTTDSLFVTRNMAEITLAATTYKAFAKNTMVTNKVTGELINMYDAYEMRNGMIEFAEGVELDPEEVNSFRVSLQKMLRDMNGNYSAYDKTLLSRRWYGPSIEFMRKFMEPFVMNRVGVERYSIEEGNVIEGYYTGPVVKSMQWNLL